MSARVLAIGTASPPRGLSQARAAELAASFIGCDPRRRKAITALYARTGIQHRGLVIAEEGESERFYGPTFGGPPPGTRARMERYAAEAPALALGACRRALDRSGRAATEITHVVAASCTGFFAPGLDQAMVRGLGLPSTVRRTVVGFMGCHAAVNALAVAGAIAESDPQATVLACCAELCGLHFTTEEKDGAGVANALFADGAAAAVVGRAPKAGVPLRRTHSVLLPDSAECMTWGIGDQGFRMTLSASVPDVLARWVPDWVRECLSAEGIALEEVGGWAIHPGGPRVVESVASGLGLKPEATVHALGVLREHGNMSSPTLLFILERLWRSGAPLPWVGMAFGPGLAGELVILG